MCYMLIGFIFILVEFIKSAIVMEDNIVSGASIERRKGGSNI